MYLLSKLFKNWKLVSTWVAKLAPDEKPPTVISLGSTEVKVGKDSCGGGGGDGGIGTHPWTEWIPRKIIKKLK